MITAKIKKTNNADFGKEITSCEKTARQAVNEILALVTTFRAAVTNMQRVRRRDSRWQRWVTAFSEQENLSPVTGLLLWACRRKWEPYNNGQPAWRVFPIAIPKPGYTNKAEAELVTASNKAAACEAKIAHTIDAFEQIGAHITSADNKPDAAHFFNALTTIIGSLEETVAKIGGPIGANIVTAVDREREHTDRSDADMAKSYLSWFNGGDPSSKPLYTMPDIEILADCFCRLERIGYRDADWMADTAFMVNWALPMNLRTLFGPPQGEWETKYLLSDPYFTPRFTADLKKNWQQRRHLPDNNVPAEIKPPDGQPLPPLEKRMSGYLKRLKALLPVPAGAI